MTRTSSRLANRRQQLTAPDPLPLTQANLQGNVPSESATPQETEAFQVSQTTVESDSEEATINPLAPQQRNTLQQVQPPAHEQDIDMEPPAENRDENNEEIVAESQHNSDPVDDVEVQEEQQDETDDEREYMPFDVTNTDLDQALAASADSKLRVNSFVYSQERILNINTPLGFFHSIPIPKNFTFSIQPLGIAIQREDIRNLFVIFTPDFCSFSIVPDISSAKLVEHVYYAKYENFEVQIFYTVSPKIESYNIQGTYFDFLLIAQILMNPHRSKPAPFVPTFPNEKFSDNFGPYKNKYGTLGPTLNSIKKLSPNTCKRGFEYQKDLLPLTFSIFSMPHLFLVPILFIGFHNIKFGPGTFENPFDGCILAIYIIAQFKFHGFEQHLLISMTIYKILRKAGFIPKNTACIFFDKHLAFSHNTKILPPSPESQVLLMLGFKNCSLTAKVHADFSFSVPQPLIPQSINYKGDQIKRLNAFILQIRQIEGQLSNFAQKFLQKGIPVHNKFFQDAYRPIIPKPEHDYKFQKPFHSYLSPKWLHGYTVQFSNINDRSFFEQHKIIETRKQLTEQKQQIQKDSSCFFCSGLHVQEACYADPKNFVATHPYQTALIKTFLRLPKRSPIYIKDTSRVQLENLRKKYSMAEGLFWKTFYQHFPHFIDNDLQEDVFVNPYPRSGFLYAIGVPLWVFKANCTGLFIPFIKKPPFFHIKASFDPSNEEQKFLLEWTHKHVAKGVIKPFPYKKLKGISQMFAIHLEPSDSNSRGRPILELIYLNAFVAHFKFHLRSAVENFYEINGKCYLVMPLDITKAYFLMMLNRRAIPWFGYELKVGNHSFFFAFLVAPFGFSPLCYIFNKIVRATFAPLSGTHALFRNFFDNFLIGVRKEDYPKQKLQALSEFLGWFFSKIEWFLNEDYPPIFRPHFQFLGTYMSLTTAEIRPALSRFHKFLEKLHHICDTAKLSPKQAAGIAGTLDSFILFGPIHRLTASEFHNFISEKMGTLNWKECKKLAQKAWKRQHNVPQSLIEGLELLGQYAKRNFSFASPSTFRTKYVLEIFSDANPDYSACTLYINNERVAESIFLGPETTSSDMFELAGLSQAVHLFQPHLEKYDSPTSLLWLGVDNSATISHCKKGSKKKSANAQVRKMYSVLLKLSYHFMYYWISRNTAKIVEVDNKGRLPPPQIFSKKLFLTFLKYHIKSPIIFLTPTVQKLRTCKALSPPFWSQFLASKNLPLIGPLFDVVMLDRLVPKFLKVKKNFILIVPNFYNHDFWHLLHKHTKMVRIPRSLLQELSRDHECHLRFDLYCAING